MPKIGEISINVTGKTDNLKRALKDGERATKDFSDKVKKSGHDAERAIEGIGKSLSTAQSALVGFVGGLGSGAAMAGLSAISQGVRGLTSAIIDGNAEFERYTMQFKVLLGGAEQAKQRLEELAKFGRETPFELPEVVRASKILQSFGGTALATGDNLRMVGDAASMAGVSIDELALWVGRFYGSLKEGKPAGEALQRFRELAIITPEFSKGLKQLVDTGGLASQAWALLVKDLDRFKGLMDEQSGTWDGMWSNMIDLVKEFARVVGKPFFDAAKEGLKATLDWFSSEGGKKAQSQFIEIAKEAGSLLKEIGPKFIETAGAGLLAFLEWLRSDAAKKAADRVIETTKAIIALAVVAKGIQVSAGVYVAWTGAMAASNAGLGLSAVAASGQVSALQLALQGLTRVPWVVTLALVIKTTVDARNALVELGEGAGRENDRLHAMMRKDSEKGVANALFALKKFGSAAAQRQAGSHNAGYNRQHLEEAMTQWKGISAFAGSKASAQKRDLADEAKKTAEDFANSLKNALGNGGGGGGGGRGGGGRGRAKSAGDVNWDPLGLIAMIKDAFAIAEEVAREQAAEFKRRTDDLIIETMRLDGASRADTFWAEWQQGKINMSEADAKKHRMDLIGFQMKEEKQDWLKQFIPQKKQEIEQIRALAKELGAEKSIEGLVQKMEESNNVFSFGFWKSLANAKLKDVDATNKQTIATDEANAAARERIRVLQEEMGIIKKDNEFAKALKAVWGGDLKNASADAKRQLMELATKRDQDIALRPAIEQSEEQTKRYNDTLRDLALRLSLVGASSEEARLQLELLSQGMTTGQAQSIVFIQRQISELEKLRDISERAADGLTSALMDSFSQIRNGAGAMFQSLVQGFRQTLAEMAQEYLRSMIRDILKNFIFSAFRRSAGSGDGFDPVTSSLGIAPRAPAVAPSAPSAPVVVNMTVNTPDVGGFLRAQGQIAQKMIQTGARAQRRNG